VSQAVAQLEAETGVTLVQRDRRGVRPTAAGMTLLSHADGILARLEAAESDLAAIAGGRGGALRMASFPTAGATLMPAAIAAFRSDFPEVRLSLAEGEPNEIAPRLRAGEFDLALLFEFHDVGDKLGAGLRRTTLFEDPMDVALPAGHRLAERKELRLADLQDEDWVQTSANSPCARHVVRSCHSAGFDPQVSFESDDYQTVQGLVAAGVGVALIPRLALTRVHRGIVVRALAPPRPDIVVRALTPGSPVRRIIAATARGVAVAPAVGTMLGVLEGVSRRYAGAAAA
jgi:DNA-binding transcriptional LysR family regulator